MSKTTIAISGIAGSFTEEAAQKFLKEKKLEGTTVFATNSKHTFEMTMNGETEYGLVPIENSNSGLVIDTIRAMADYVFHIESILEIDVQQNLIALPGVTRDDIKEIVSQKPALDQCKFYLRRRWHGEMHEYEDTALAAKDLSEGKLPKTTAVIASRRAAELYKLEILEPSIQDLKFNYTSFLAFTKKS